MNKAPLISRPLAAAIAAALLQVPAAAAEDPAAPARVQALGGVVVTDSKEATLTAPSAEEARKSLERVPGGAEVVDAEEYLVGRASNLYDALRFAPGVFIQPRFGAEEARLSIRGSGIQRTFHLRGIKLLQDGVPLNQADGGGDFQSIDPTSLRYIEVFRGANALQYGSTTLGGAINFVTPTGYDTAPVSLRGEAGSFGYWRARASGGGVNGPWDYFGNLGAYGQQGYQDHSRQEAYRLFTNLGRRIDENLENRFYLAAVDSVSFLPGSLSKAELELNPRGANPANLAGNYQRNYKWLKLADKLSWRQGPGRLDASVFYTYKDLYHPIFQVIDQETNDYGIDLRYTYDGEIGGYRNVIVAGFVPVQGKTNANQFVNVFGERGAPTLVAQETATNLDFYLQDEIYMRPDVALVLGFQATEATRKFSDELQPLRSFKNTYDGFSPRVGALYEFRPGMQVFGNVSGVYEPPSFGELVQAVIQPGLRAQKGTSYEIGSRGQLGGGWWDFAYYYVDLEDELLTQRNNIGQTLTLNVPATYHQGIEFAGLLPLPADFHLRGSYLWNDFRFDDNLVFGNNRLPGIPPQYVQAEAGWSSNDLYAAVFTEWVPQKYPVDMVNSVFADPYATLGARVGQRRKTGFSWFVEGRNLTDQKFAATTGVTLDARLPGANRQFNPGDGRAVYAGIEWNL